MQKIIYGNLEINNETYPFFLQNQTVRIVQQAFQYNKELDYENISTIKGVTNDTRDILFLNCKFTKSLFAISFSIQGYILSKSNTGKPCDFAFDRLSFYSDALNVFYSPQNAAETQIGVGTDLQNWDGSMQIGIKSFSDTDTTFQFMDANCTLSIERYRNLKEGTTSIGDMTTSLIFCFSETKSPDIVCQYYLYVFDFLSFVSYSKNIPFKKIILYKKVDEKYVATGQATIFSNASTYDRSPYNSITMEDLPKDKIGTIFNQIATLRERDNRLHLYYPDSAEDSRYVSHSKWLMTAICFEGLFKNTYPNYKSQSNDLFNTVKTGILKSIEEYRENAHLNKKQKKYYEALKEHINRYEGKLEEKFNFVFNKYNNELSKIINSIKQTNEIGDKEDYGHIYQEFRNKIAHGTIVPISDKEVAIYRLLCPMIYILLLHNAALDSKELKTIIEKIFT